jgi:alpha-L-rhamnosidase
MNPLGIDSLFPRFSWCAASSSRPFAQTAYRIVVATSEEKLEDDVGDMWDSARVESDDSNQIEYKGRDLESSRRYFWKIMCWDQCGVASRFSEPAYFEMGLLHESDWTAQWIGASQEISAPLLRTTFMLSNQVEWARIHICGLGYHELHVNGCRISDQVLVPNWTDYDDRDMSDLLYPFSDDSLKKVLYLTHDVTRFLHPGINSIGVMLGNGWYNQRERIIEGALWYGSPRLFLQAEIRMVDGASVILKTDGRWKTSPSHIVQNNVFLGETHDLRMDQPGWTLPDFDDSLWHDALIVGRPKGVLCAQLCPPDRVIGTLEPVAIRDFGKTTRVCDMGRNLTGWIDLTVSGKRGDRIELWFAEEIDEEGQLQFDSAGGSDQIQRDAFILRGEGPDRFEPRFTWHGFRYVEISGDLERNRIVSVLGKIVHSDISRMGRFECSSDLLNRIQETCVATQLQNLHGGVPSDCPHRERLGYTGDGQVTAESAIYNLDMAAFYTKWIDDIMRSQNRKTGFVPHTAPFYGGGGGYAWGSACIILPWLMYLHYADVQILRRYYANMVQWMRYCGEHVDEEGIVISEEQGSWCLGDWSTPGEVTVPPSLVNTFFYLMDARTMVKIAQRIGCVEDAHAFQRQVLTIAECYHRRFFDPQKGNYADGKQGADAFSISAGVVPADEMDRVVRSLSDNIMVTNNGHLDTGIFGTPVLLDVLCETGQIDTAWAIVSGRTYPSYGHMLEQGATTLWENWNKDTGSHNHPMFGSVSAWFYRRIAGIRPDPEHPGYRNILIEPCNVGPLSRAASTLDTIRGSVSVSWCREAGAFHLDVRIPGNCRSSIHLPLEGEGPFSVYEGESELLIDSAADPGIGTPRLRSVEGNRAFLSTGSGEYHFRAVDIGFLSGNRGNYD